MEQEQKVERVCEGYLALSQLLDGLLETDGVDGWAKVIRSSGIRETEFLLKRENGSILVEKSMPSIPWKASYLVRPEGVTELKRTDEVKDEITGWTLPESGETTQSPNPEAAGKLAKEAEHFVSVAEKIEKFTYTTS